MKYRDGEDSYLANFVGNTSDYQIISECLDYFAAQKGKDYVKDIVKVMRDNISSLQQEFNVEPKDDETLIEPFDIVIFTDLVMAKFLRLPIPKDIRLWQGKELLEMQHSALEEPDILSDDLRKKIFEASMWSIDSELIIRQTAMKKCMRFLYEYFENHTEEYITVQHVWFAFDELEKESEGLPVRNVEMFGKNSDRALDIIAEAASEGMDKYIGIVSNYFYKSVK